MQKFWTKGLLLSLAVSISSCVSTLNSPVGDEVRVLPTATFTHVSTPPTAESTDVSITSISESNSEVLWARYQSSGDRMFVLGKEEISIRILPLRMGEFYGYNPQNNEILMALDFPDRGAGPGGVSVSDLSILNLESGNVKTLLDDNVVKGLWSPDGNALAYILANNKTYELHWRTPDGLDRTLAHDVSFTWSIAPSGRAVAFTRESGYEIEIDPGLYVVEIDSGEVRMIAGVDKQGTGSIMDQPYWSPDSSELILSHWGGPDEPRLILAKADGSGSIDLFLDEGLSGEWWATIALTDIIWDTDGQHLLTLSSVSSSEMGGPSPLVYYHLDRASGRLTDGILLAEVDIIIGWATPGRSIWVLSYGGDAIQVALP